MMNRRIPALRLRTFSLALSLIVTAETVFAEPHMPEWTKGWWYYTGVNTPNQYAADPITACRFTAKNHAAAPLLGALVLLAGIPQGTPVYRRCTCQ
jgi:hypothetical protein